MTFEAQPDPEGRHYPPNRIINIDFNFVDDRLEHHLNSHGYRDLHEAATRLGFDVFDNMAPEEDRTVTSLVFNLYEEGSQPSDGVVYFDAGSLMLDWLRKHSMADAELLDAGIRTRHSGEPYGVFNGITEETRQLLADINAIHYMEPSDFS